MSRILSRLAVSALAVEYVLLYRRFFVGAGELEFSGTAAVARNLANVGLTLTMTLFAAGLGRFLLSLAGFGRAGAGRPSLAASLVWGLAAATAAAFAVNLALGFGFAPFAAALAALMIPAGWALPDLFGDIGRGLGDLGRDIRATPPPARLATVCGLAATMVLTGWAMVLKGLYPDYGGDIFVYYSYYALSLAGGSLFPGVPESMVYFPNKASGLHLFLAALTGVHTLPLASLTAWLLMGLLLYRVAARLGAGPLLRFLPLFLASANFEILVFTNNFSKSNFTGAVLVLALIVFMDGMARRDPAAARENRWAFAGALAQTAFFSLNAWVFSLAAAGVAFVRTFRDRPARRFVLAALALFAVCGLFVGIVNHFRAGFFDILTAAVQIRHGLTGTLSNVTCAYLHNFGIHAAFHDKLSAGAYLATLGDVLASRGFLGTRYLDLVWPAAAYALASLLLRPERDDDRRRARSYLFYLGAFLFYALAVSAISSEYDRKHAVFVFGSLLKILLYVTAIPLLGRALVKDLGRGRPRLGRVLPGLLEIVFFAAAAALALWQYPFNLRDDARGVIEVLSGDKPHIEVFATYYPELRACLRAMEAAPGAATLYTAADAACASFAPTRVFDQYSSTVRALDHDILAGDAETAEAALAALGVTQVIVNLDSAPTILLSSPALSLDRLAGRYRLVETVGGTKLILTRDASAGAPLAPALLAAIGDYYAKGQVGPDNPGLTAYLDFLAGQCGGRGAPR